MNGALTFERELLIEAASGIFRSAGISQASATTVADALVAADARGVPSHGLMLVPMYVDRLRAGSVGTHEKADVVVDLGAMAVLDAHNALGQLTSDQAMAMAIEKAAVFGVGAVSVRHAFHFGGAFRYAEQAASRGCIGIAMSNTRPLMPATGGSQAVVGNNPVAIGVPRQDGRPVVLDMALSEAALGKIRLAEAEGRDIPPTWATDTEGRSTTDPAAAVAGMLLPIGGPKGYGLAFMVDVLTGVLSGGGFGARVQGMYADVTRPNDCSHFFLALDVASFDQHAAESFADRVQELVGQVLGSPPAADNTDRVYLPGEREQLQEDRAASGGIAVSASVVRSLVATAATLGAALPAALAYAS